MDVTITLREKSQCRLLQIRNNEFTNDCETAFFKGRGRLCLCQTELICMSLDKNDLHRYQLPMTYRAKEKLKGNESCRATLESESDDGEGCAVDNA